MRTLLQLAFFGSLLSIAPISAQERGSGTVTGTVTRKSDGSRLAAVSVSLRGAAASAVTGTDGRFVLRRVPEGAQTLLFRWLGYQPQEAGVQVTAGGTHTVDVALEAVPITLGEIVVEGASRAPERVVEAPAAVAVLDPIVSRSVSVTGQVPLALATAPGVDVVQSGMNDFNINARGYNSTLNRRVLVMQDSRDLSIAFLGAQEWNGMSLPLEDLGRIEVVRGPGSALYGANAFAGVVNINTPAAREVVGTKVTLAGGGLSTLRADVRQAGLFSEGRLGYRVNFGYNRSDTWTRSRTLLTGGDFIAEYDSATDQSVNRPPPGFELRPLDGQTRDAGTGAASGERDPLVNMYGAARLDYYADNGAVGTVEGGATQVENEVFVTGIGRVQVLKGFKPWSRLAWVAPQYNVTAWYTGRDTKDPQFSLASGAPLIEHSAIFHVEGQYHHGFASDAGRFVLGASFRQYNVNTDSSLMAAADDNRSDSYYSTYGQIEYKLLPTLRAVVAGRFDKGDLFDGQFSPKGALVYSPNERHSVRVTVNRAFQTPNYSELFLRAVAGRANLSLLEAGLRASPLGPALAGVPSGTLFTTSPAVPVLALGNGNLTVEKVTGFEAGYKGNLTSKLYVGVDVYHNRLSNFVTDLLPGVNPSFGRWTAPTQVPTQFHAPLEAAVRQQLLAANQPVAANGLTRLANGSTSIVVSYANAGKVKEQGVEFSAGYLLTDELRVEGSYTFFDFDPPEGSLAGDQLLPNTPKHKGTLNVQYAGAQGLDLGVMLRRQTAFNWAAGVFSGVVDWSQTVNVNAGYQIGNNLRLHAIATNVLDQKRFHIYGGSVIGRRVVAGVTATF
jgi:iron complex outermembrane receptor protein